MLEFGSHISTAGGLHKSLQRGVDVGATSIQIFSKNERQWNAKPLDPDIVEKFLVERERSSIGKMVVHDSYLINLASPKEDILAKSMDAFADELNRAETLGIEYLVTHPGAHTGSGAEAGIRTFAESLNRLHDQLPDLKVITCLETTAGQGTTLGRTFEELAQIRDLVEAKDRVAVCLDTCHVFAAGYEFRTPEDYADMTRQFDETIGLENLKVLHLNDSKMPFGSNRDRHAHIGEGEIGVEGFRQVVNDPRLAGLPAILETDKGPAGDMDQKNFAMLRGLVRAE